MNTALLYALIHIGMGFLIGSAFVRHRAARSLLYRDELGHIAWNEYTSRWCTLDPIQRKEWEWSWMKRHNATTAETFCDVGQRVALSVVERL